jgi:hypothetical protein
LFEGPRFESGHDFAVTPERRGFILIRESDAHSGVKEMHIAVNWIADSMQRVPVNK